MSNKCKDYVVELLDLCQTSEEIVAILNEDSTGAPKEPTNSQQSTNAAPGDKDINAPTNNDEFVGLARVKLALKYEQKRVSVIIIECPYLLLSCFQENWVEKFFIEVKPLRYDRTSKY